MPKRVWLRVFRGLGFIKIGFRGFRGLGLSKTAPKRV